MTLKCCKCGKRTRKFTQVCESCGHRFCKLRKGATRAETAPARLIHFLPRVSTINSLKGQIPPSSLRRFPSRDALSLSFNSGDFKLPSQISICFLIFANHTSDVVRTCRWNTSICAGYDDIIAPPFGGLIYATRFSANTARNA